jgi:hypothetical protein
MMLGLGRILALFVLCLTSYAQSSGGSSSLTITVKVDSTVQADRDPHEQHADTPRPGRPRQPEVEYHFQVRADDRDIQKHSVIMNVGSADKPDYQPVLVTTIVPK